MYALLFEDAGYDVELKLGLAGTPVAHAALLNAEIDLYPEYLEQWLDRPARYAAASESATCEG